MGAQINDVHGFSPALVLEAKVGFSRYYAYSLPVNYGTPQQQFTLTGTGASPDLKSQKSDQFDASLEYYFGNAGQLSAAVFYKRLRNLIIAENTVETFTNANGNSADFNLLRYVNADKLLPHPDCGLKTRTVEESLDKCRVVVEAAKKVRAEVG